jgi:serine/threonine protein phosphatase PrpC
MGCAASSGGAVGDPSKPTSTPERNVTFGSGAEQTPAQPTPEQRQLNTGDDFFAGGLAPDDEEGADTEYDDPVQRYQGRPHATSLSQKPFRVAVSTAEVAANAPCEDRMEVRDTGETAGQTIIGLFDGHGGASASQFCVERTLDFFMTARDEGMDVAKALSACVSRSEEGYLAQCRARHAKRDSRGVLAGTCALIVHVDKLARAISVANVGDSRAVLAERDSFGILSASPLSFDHSAQSDYERHRLVSTFGEAAGKAGGGAIVHEEFDEYVGDYNRTVHGLTMFTRSIGDFELKHNFAAEFFNGLVPEDKELPPVRSTDRTDPTHSRRGKDCALIYPGWRAHMWPWC